MKELRLIRWANDGYPPICLSNELEGVLELIREVQTLRNSKGDVIRRFRAVEKAYALLLDKKYGWLSLSNKIDELGEALAKETFL